MPTRREALAWGTAAAATPWLAACAESPGAARISTSADRKPGQKIMLVFWTWVPLQKTVELWNSKNPDVQVELQIVPGGTNGGYQKMHASLKAGNPPDLAQVEYHELPSFMLVNGLTDLTRFGAEKLAPSYVDWQWQQGVFGGRVRTIPQASGPLGFYYRRDLFERWDVEVPTTWEAFEQAARDIRRRGGGARICSFPPANPNWFAGLVWQRGARWFRTEDDTWIVDIDGAESREVADYWDRLVRDDLVTLMPELQPGWYQAMQTGQLASWVGAQWGDALLRNNAPGTSGKWSVTSMPQWEPGALTAANWGGSSTAILQGTRHAVEAMEFAHWLNTDPESIDLLIASGYGWPAAKIDYRQTALGKPDPFFGGQRYNDVFAEADQHIDTSWKWSPTHDQSQAHLADAFGRVASGKGTFAEALEDCQDRVVDDLKAKGLKVRSAR
ncbi:extracellular solute-binding protein [Streptomyces sp. NPDC051940]|uniref:ABC transporter substrate-binding protein n=1 Tax=Streptomyces sp. NPDC051940 TaxID=3155675 RepID=UPI003412F7AF